MAEPKTRPTKEKLSEYLARVEDPARRKDCETIAKLMAKATGEKAVMWGTGIVGFGVYMQQYANGSEMEWPITGFAARKNDLTLYIMSGLEDSTELLGKLGKHKVSKACLYIKKLSDVDVPTLTKIIENNVHFMSERRVRKPGTA